MLLEEIIIYGITFAIIIIIIWLYLRAAIKTTQQTTNKIEKAKEYGLYEPISLHPVVNQEICIGSAACIEACPEKDILGLVNGRATPVNASRCVGHGACFHACPVNAITLCIGTEKRGVDLPHVSKDFETNVPGIFIAGELGGMGLIKNAVEQGKQVVESIAKKASFIKGTDADIIIIGAGPAGIAASLAAKEKKIRALTLEQDTIGGTVYTFPRRKLVMTAPMNLPLVGKVKLTETSKDALISLWQNAITKNELQIHEQEKVEQISKSGAHFTVVTQKTTYTGSYIVLAIGRRGTPRKLGVRGELSDKVFYRLLEPELIRNQRILVVGGGDSAIESALLLADEENEVTLSYRAESFSRLKPKNSEKIEQSIAQNRVQVLFESVVTAIEPTSVLLTVKDGAITIPNDLVYIFAGGELPTSFLEKCGITVTKRFGESILKH